MFATALVAVACTSASSSDPTVEPTAEPTAVQASGDSSTSQPDQPSPTPDSPTPAPTATIPAVTPTSTPAPTPRAISTDPASNRIALTSTDGSIYTINPDGSDRQRVTATGASLPGGLTANFYAWPSWSPDGRHLLITGFTADGAGGIETSLLRAPAASVSTVPDVLYRDLPGTTGIGGIPHFPLWHPEASSVALIANIGGGLLTFLIDVEEGPDQAVSNGAPVYIHWSPDGSHMLVHTAELLVRHDFSPGGEPIGSEQIGTGSLSYRVAKFSPLSDDYVYVGLFNSQHALLIGSAAEATPKQIGIAGENNSFEWSPNGDRIAVGDGRRAGIFDRLKIVDPNGDADDAVIADTPLFAFWWSPDGKQILAVLPGNEPSNLGLAIIDSATGDVENLGFVEPSSDMLFVLAFFDQYTPDLNVWSPDSSRFVFSGVLGEGLAVDGAGRQVQFGDEDSSVWVIDPSGASPPLSLGSGVFGTWSPE